jgi:hypothetical protein
VLGDHNLSWSPYFRDPDGNPYEIMNKAAKQGLARK